MTLGHDSADGLIRQIAVMRRFERQSVAPRIRLAAGDPPFESKDRPERIHVFSGVKGDKRMNLVGPQRLLRQCDRAPCDKSPTFHAAVTFGHLHSLSAKMRS